MYIHNSVGRKRRRCENCVGCKSSDCKTCRFCLDKPKYGGKGTLKQGCVKRRCTTIGKLSHSISPKLVVKELFVTAQDKKFKQDITHVRESTAEPITVII